MSDRVKLLSNEPDGGSAVAHELDTVEDLAAGGALLLKLSNQGVSKFTVDGDGSIATGFVDSVPVAVVASSAGGIYKTMAALANGTSDLEFNVQALAGALAQAIEMRTVMVTHFSSVAAHTIADPTSWAQVNAVATVNGTAGGLITVLGAPTLAVDNLIYVGNNPPIAVQPAVGYVASRDITTTLGSTIYHITVGAGGAGGNVDLSGYTVALGAHIFRSINVLPANPTNLSTLVTFVNVLRQGFALHDADADLGAAWQYHFADEVGPHLPNLALPLTTLVEAIAVLTDLHAVYDAHIAENATHNAAVDIGPTTLPDPTYGTAIWITETIVAPGDVVTWSILNGGAGAVKGVSAVAGTGGITFTFSANPAADTVFGYTVHRVI